MSNQITIRDILGLKTSTKSRKSQTKEMFELPIKDIKDLIIHKDGRHVLLCHVSPVNGELLPEDVLADITDAIQGALSSFDGRVGIYVQSETINIDGNLAIIDKRMQDLNSEIKLYLLSKQREHLASMINKSRNVLNFYVALEQKADNYIIAEQLLDDAFLTFKSELEGQEMYTEKMNEHEIKELIYKRLNPEASIAEPYNSDFTLANIVPPNAALYEDGRHIEIENRISRYYSITKFPANVEEYRWLRKIFTNRGEINAAFILTPKNKSTIQKELDKAFESSRRMANDETKKESEKQELENQRDSAQQMLAEIGSDNVSFYDVNVTIGVSGKDMTELNTVSNSLRSKINSSYCQSTEIKRKEFDPLFTTLPILVENKLTRDYVWNFSSRDIGSMILFDSSEFMEERGSLVGENVTSGGIVIADPQNPIYNNGHLCILADSGFGKTFFLMCDAARNFPYVDYIIMFDLKGDLIFPWGKRYIFTPASGLCLNPFHIRNAIIDMQSSAYDMVKVDVGGYLQQKIMDLIVFFRWITPDLTSYDEGLLEEDIRDAYKECNLDFSSTVLPSKFCTLSTLSEVQKEKISCTNGMEKSRREYILACFKPYTTGAYASMFNGQTNVEFDEFTVFVLANCPEAVKKPLYDLLLKDTWQFCKKDGTKNPTKKRVYVDECHEFADPKNPQTLEFISVKLSKQSRGFGVRLITATQNLPDFLSIPKHGQAIIDNSFFKLFGRLGESDLPVAQNLYKFSEAEMRILKGSTSRKKSGKGRGIFIVGAQRVVIQTRASRFELEFIDPEQYEETYCVPSRFKDGKQLSEVI